MIEMQPSNLAGSRLPVTHLLNLDRVPNAADFSVAAAGKVFGKTQPTTPPAPEYVQLLHVTCTLPHQHDVLSSTVFLSGISLHSVADSCAL